MMESVMFTVIRAGDVRIITDGGTKSRPRDAARDSPRSRVNSLVLLTPTEGGGGGGAWDAGCHRRRWVQSYDPHVISISSHKN